MRRSVEKIGTKPLWRSVVGSREALLENNKETDFSSKK